MGAIFILLAVGTLGVDLIGIATALGLSTEITAGAIISGAYFGDKMSPLSETTNLASAVATGFVIETGYAGLDDLFTRGGMASMLTTVWLIIAAMAFGGVLEYTGLLARLLQPLLKAAKSDRALVAATGVTAIGMNVVAGDQYMSI